LYLAYVTPPAPAKAHVERLTGVYKNMTVGVVALVFRCSPAAVTSSSRTSRPRWPGLPRTKS
jgi:hypothetical protein